MIIYLTLPLEMLYLKETGFDVDTDKLITGYI